MRIRRATRISCAIVALVLLGLAIWLGPVVYAFWRSGILGDMVGSTPKMEFDSSRANNLKALHTAMMQYHDSAGAFPPADRWMDALEPYLFTEHLAEGEANEKLRRPGLPRGEFGYSMNPAFAGMYIEDFGGDVLLVFESEETSRNVSGPPPDGAVGITAGGELVGLGK